MSDFTVVLNANYVGIFQTLIRMLQSQVLQSLKTRFEQSWSIKFLEVYDQMTSFELKYPRDPKFSISCKELCNYLENEKHQNRPKNMIKKVYTKSRPSSIYKHISIPSISYTSNSPSSRIKTASRYYSKIMNNFLSVRTPISIKQKKKSENLENKDFWLIGDDIKYIE